MPTFASPAFAVCFRPCGRTNCIGRSCLHLSTCHGTAENHHARLIPSLTHGCRSVSDALARRTHTGLHASLAHSDKRRPRAAVPPVSRASPAGGPWTRQRVPVAAHRALFRMPRTSASRPGERGELARCQACAPQVLEGPRCHEPPSARLQSAREQGDSCAPRAVARSAGLQRPSPVGFGRAPPPAPPAS